MKSIKHTIALSLVFFMMLSYMPFYPSFAEYEISAEGEVTDEASESAETQDDEQPGEVSESEDEEESEIGEETKEESVQEPASNPPNNSEGEIEPSNTKENNNEEALFDADKRDFLSYDPLYVEKYANRDYVNADEVEIGRYIDVVTAAKGIATYNRKKQSDFDVTESNYIAGMNYEMPVYNIDDESEYYIAIPNVNKFNSNFNAYNLMLAYNNDYGEIIEGWKYEKGILYIPKGTIDSPTNKHKVADNAIIAVQLNYAIGSDMDFSKRIPVQVLSGEEPKEMNVSAENIFDLNCLAVDTGVKGRKASEVSVFLNGHMIPINKDAWEYDSKNGRIEIQAMPGVVSNINVVFEKQRLRNKAKNLLTSALNLVGDEAYASTTKSMDYLKNESGEDVILDFDTSLMFVGWRGHYTSKIIHTQSAARMNELEGWHDSVSYLYGGYTERTGGDFVGASDKEIDSWLVPLWAIQSYAVGADVGKATNTPNINKDTLVKHYVTTSSTESHTMYEWLMSNRNNLERSSKAYAEGDGNSIGGANNFAAHWPIRKVEGSEVRLTPDGRANPDITFKSDQINSSQWFAASCSELDDAAASERDDDVYVTCLEITDEYVVLAFVQARGGQNMCAIYKFKVRPKGYMCIKKVSAKKDNDYLKIAPANYSLAGAEYHLFTDNKCTKRAKDINNEEIVLKTGADGSTGTVEVSPGVYYAKEVKASKGFKLESADANGNYKGVSVSENNTISSPAVIQSIEEPVYTNVRIYLQKMAEKDGWRRLIGASYKLSYYNLVPGSDIAGKSPVRSWIIKTSKKQVNSVKYEAGIDFSIDPTEEGSDKPYLENGVRVLPLGVFTIEEYMAPDGLALDSSVHSGRIVQLSNGADASLVFNESGNEKLTIENAQGLLRLTHLETEQGPVIKIQKKDALTGEAKAQGTDREYSRGSLAGAEYNIYFDDKRLPKPELVGTIVTDEEGKGILSKREKGNEGLIGSNLDPGDYFIEEVKASPGYVTDKFYLKDEKGVYEEGRHILKARVLEGQTALFEYTVESPELPHETEICKTDAATSEELAGASLQVINSDGEIVDEWVSNGKPHVIMALPDGVYTLREISAPYGYDIAEDISFEIKENVVKNKVEMKNKPLKIGTEATDTESGTHNGSFTEIVIKDTVKIEGLCEDRRYIVKGCLVDKENGEILTDAEGNPIEAESEEFTSNGKTAMVELFFNVDATYFTADTAVVAFERLYRTSPVRDEDVPIELAKHEDINDDAQTVHFGGIAETIAMEKNSEGKEVPADESVVVSDIVTYSNLSTRETYVMEGELFDKTTGELTGIKGKTVFTPGMTDGRIAVEFEFNAEDYYDHKLVVFEKLSLNGRVLSVHDDPDNENQTVLVTEPTPRNTPKTGDSKRQLFLVLLIFTAALLALTAIYRSRINRFR